MSDPTGEDIGHLREIARQLQDREKPELIPKLSRGKRIKLTERHVANLLLGMCAPVANQAADFVINRSALVPVSVYRKWISEDGKTTITEKLDDEQTEYLLGPRVSLVKYIETTLTNRHERPEHLQMLHSFNVFQNGPVAMMRLEYSKGEGKQPRQYEVWYLPFGQRTKPPANDGNRAVTSMAILPGRVVRLVCDLLDELDEDEILERYAADAETGDSAFGPVCA